MTPFFGKPTGPLRGVSDIRRFFQRNETPIYFISATNFNLLGADEWVKGFKFVNYIDCFDGQHPNVFVPGELPHDAFESIEDINNYLLEHKEVADYVAGRGPGGKAMFLMFDEKTEELADELGLEICFAGAVAPAPRQQGRHHPHRRRGRRGVRAKRPGQGRLLRNAAPPIRGSGDRPGDPDPLRRLRPHHVLRLGRKRLAPLRRRDNPGARSEGHEADPPARDGRRGLRYQARHHRRAADDGACGLRRPHALQGRLVRKRDLRRRVRRNVRQQARRATSAIGERLREESYRGYFELDFLIDEDSGKLYLGEMNPRITGASSITNHTVFALADAPLFLFHLLEWMDVDYELDVGQLNERWARPENIDTWSQLVIKHTAETVEVLTGAPPTGIWRMDGEGEVRFSRYDTHRRAVESEAEAFFLRISNQGDYRYEGADLGILVTRGRLMDQDFRLNERARTWIRGLKSCFETEETSGPKPRTGHASPRRVQDTVIFG